MILLITLLFTSCGINKLKTERVDFNSDKFKTSGFYYSNPNSKNYYYSRCYVFYKNGVFFENTLEANDKGEIKKFLLDRNKINLSRELPYSWGIFQVKGDSIIFEKWISTDEFGGYPTIIYYGKVINDQSILLNTPVIKTLTKKPTEFKIDTLFFCPLLAKPDSTNKFIK